MMAKLKAAAHRFTTLLASTLNRSTVTLSVGGVTLTVTQPPTAPAHDEVNPFTGESR